MTLSILLLKKLASLLIFMMVGGLLVKINVLKRDAYKVVSTLTLYFVNPCQIFSTFRIEDSSYSPKGLLISFIGASLLYVTSIVFGTLTGKKLKLNSVESVSMMYPNAGSIVVVLVTAVLGKEYGVYCIANVVVSTVLLWTHARWHLNHEGKTDVMKIILNPNIIAIILAGIMAFTGLSLPDILNDSIETAGSMSGCMSMLVTGMILGGMTLDDVMSYKRIWIVVLGRLVLIPLCFLTVLKVIGFARLFENGKMILLIPFIAACSCCAATIVQMCAEYNLDDKYASSVNVVTTVLCIVTMPVMIYLYELVI